MLCLSHSLSGRAWTATDLRSKSWDDLHALWYVLLKERARLAASADASRAARSRPANPARAAKVRKSMARIKLVLSERAAAHPEPVKSYELRAFVDAL
jgi:large subunit ribosomal protein L47